MKLKEGIEIKPEDICRSELLKSTLSENVPDEYLGYPVLDDTISANPKKYFTQFKKSVFRQSQAHERIDTKEKFSKIPEVGEKINLSSLGISISLSKDPPPEIPGGINVRVDPDLDIDPTDEPPHEGKYPNLHLNLRSTESKDSSDHLVMSDFPESIRDTNQIIDSAETSANGIYMLSTIPANSSVKFLLGHINYTNKQKEVKTFIIPKEDGTLYFYKKGSAVNKDAAVAGSLATFRKKIIIPKPELELKKGEPVDISKLDLLNTGQTLVRIYEFKTSCEIQIMTVVADTGELRNPQEAELLSLPRQRIQKWKEKSEELKKFVDPESRRYRRLLEEYIHARGLFNKPDKTAYSDYNPKKDSQPVQFYSIEEAIPGMDELTREEDQSAKINNRGRYGATTTLHLDIRSLPKNTEEFAILAINTSNASGGEFEVSVDEKATNTDFLMMAYQAKNLIEYNEGAVIWRGKLKEGSSIDIRHIPLPHASSKIWYVIIPVK